MQILFKDLLHQEKLKENITQMKDITFMFVILRIIQ